MDRKYSLAQIAEITEGRFISQEGKAIPNYNALLISAIGTDTRKNLEGCLFIAIAGERLDGHNYLEQAVTGGAAALLVHNSEHAEMYSQRVPVILVEDTHRALMRLARAYRDELNAICIAVTGSVGKTSTRDTIAACLRGNLEVHQTLANLNNTFGVPFCVLDIAQSAQTAVIEMGMEKSGEMQQMSFTAHPDITVITNIGTSHIEHFSNRFEIALEKAAILSSQKEGGPLIINAEDPYLLEIARLHAGERPIYLIHAGGAGLQLHTHVPEDDIYPAADADYINKVSALCAEYQGLTLFNKYPSGTQFFADAIEETATGMTFTLCIRTAEGQVTREAKLRLMKPGISLVQNTLFGLAISQVLEQDLTQAIRSLHDLQLTSGRQQIEGIGQTGFLIDDTYNASPESMRAAFHLAEILAENPSINRKIAIIGGVNELGRYAEDLHRDIGSAAGSARFNVYYVLGPWAEVMKEGILRAFPEAAVHCFTEQKELIDAVQQEEVESSLFLVKASRGYYMENVCNALRRQTIR